MNKQTRYWVRRVIFIALIALIGVALYQVIQGGNQKQPQIGDEAPDFTLTTLDGKEASLSQLRGKAVMLNFWGSWCEPCRTEMPAMQEVYEKYKDQGFEIVAVNIGETDVAAASFAKQLGLTFPIWMDRDRDIVDLYHIGPIPSSFFIDAQGKIVRKVNGQLDTSQLELYINPILPRNQKGEASMSSYTNVEARELSQASEEKRNQYVWVDVRTEKEYQEGHIPNTILIPHDQMEQRSDELLQYKDKEIMLVCRSGNRSAIAAETLAKKGFTNLYNLKGGMLEWTGPIEKK